LRILHVFRAPVGGLFRHVCDLVRGQVALGHDVGIFCDSTTGGANAEAALAKVLPLCKLGITRQPMSIMPKFGDFRCVNQARKLAVDLDIDILHGHGAKGGLYARLAAKLAGRRAVYTPHGGSVHYNWSGFQGVLFLATEVGLRYCTAGLAFVCEYERELYDRKIGTGRVPISVVHNGLWTEEFKAAVPAADASDLLFVGEMCHRKGVDIMLRAIAALKPQRRLTAAMVGDGPDIKEYKALTLELGLAEQVRFHGRLGIIEALPLGRLFVLPSRNESFPYVVLEAIAAARPVVSTKVGGLAEVLPEVLLYQSEEVSALTDKLRDVFDNPHKYQSIIDQISAEAPLKFSAETMVQRVTDFYSQLK
jgi:glycosyltransferase involved in cell wall biosynthesis